MFFRVLDSKNKPAQKPEDAFQLTATEGIHSLFCRTQKSVNSIMQYLAWILLGNVYLFCFLENN